MQLYTENQVLLRAMQPATRNVSPYQLRATEVPQIPCTSKADGGGAPQSCAAYLHLTTRFEVVNGSDQNSEQAID